MAKYLWQVSYTPQGAQRLRKGGGSARRTVVQRLVEQAVTYRPPGSGAK